MKARYALLLSSLALVALGHRASAQCVTPTFPFTGQTVFKDMEVQIDENLLKSISKETKGEYFRAENNQELKEIYRSIDRLEKSKIKVSAYTPKQELYFIFIFIGLLILTIEWMVKAIYLKQDI